MLNRSHISAFCFCLFSCMFLVNQRLASQDFISLKKVEMAFDSTMLTASNSNDSIYGYRVFVERFINRGNLNKVDSLLSYVIPYVESKQDSSILADLIKQRAFMYKVQGRFPKSLEGYLWLIDFHKRRNNLNELAESYSLLAEFYRATSQFDLMEFHLKLAEDIIKDYEVDEQYVAYWYSRKAAFATEYRGGPDSVLYFSQKALQLATSSGDIYTQALALNEIGFLHYNSRTAPELYFDFLGRSKDLLLANEYYLEYVFVMNNLARAIGHTDPQAGVDILENIIPIEEENGWYAQLSNSLGLIQSHYIQLGLVDKIDEAKHQQFKANIAQLKISNAMAVSDLALTYENELRKTELEIQEQKTALAEVSAKNNKNAFATTAIIAFSLAIITTIVFVVNRKFKKQNELLDNKSKTIAEANEKLEKALRQQTALYKELNHRVKNNLTVLSGLVHLQELEATEKNSQNSFANLRGRIKSMAIAHESLYSNNFNDTIDLSSYIKQLFDQLKSALTQKQKIDIDINLPVNFIEINQVIPLAIILNELFTNSIKHAFKTTKNGAIRIYGEQYDDSFLLDYRDNGSGYTGTKKDNLGFELIALLMEQLEGHIEDSTSDKGVHIQLKFPVNSPKAVA